MNFLLGRVPFSAVRLKDSQVDYRVRGRREDGVKFDFGGDRMLEQREYKEWLTLDYEHGKVTISTYDGKATIRDDRNNRLFVRTCGATDYEVRQQGVCEDFITAIVEGREPYLRREDLLINTLAGIILTETGTM